MAERRRRYSRTARLAAVVGVAAVGLLLAAAFLVYARAERALRAQATLRVKDTATLAAELVAAQTLRFSELVQERAQDLSSLSRRPLDRLSPAQAKVGRGELQTLRLGTVGLRSVGLVSPQGRLLLADPPHPALVGRSFAFRDWYRGVTSLHSPYVSRVFRDATGRKTATVAALVRAQRGGRVIAILTVGLQGRAQALADAIATSHGVGLVVTDQGGGIVARSGTSPNAMAAMLGDPDVRAALRGRSGTSERDGLLGSYAPVPGTGWAVVARLPASVAFRSVHELATILILVCAILGAVLAALVGGLVLLLRRAERAQAAEASRLRGLLESAPDATVISRTDGRIVFVNAQAAHLFGHAREDLLGKSVEMLVPERYRSAHAGHRAGYFARPSVRAMGAGLELYALRSDGHEFPVEISLSPLQTPGGTLVSSAIRDISERRRIESSLRDAEEQLALSFDHSPLGIVLALPPGRPVRVNRAFADMIGYTVADVLAAEHPERFTHPDDRGIDELHVRALLDGHVDAAHWEKRYVHADGHTVWADVSVSLLHHDDGRPRLLIGQVQDISERKRTDTDRRREQNALREAEERFRQAFEEAPIGMAMLALDGRFEQVNDALCAITGYSREQLEATTSAAITHPDDLHTRELDLSRVLAGETDSIRVEKRYVHASGHPVWVAKQATLIRDGAGAPVRVLLQVQDVTDRRRYEEQLRHLADHDGLTGLLNRRSFEREVAAHRTRAKRYGVEGALIVLDLDQFKYINDTLGHGAGDDAIVRAATTLRSRLRETDVLARLGGDEFAVLLPKASAHAARLVASDLIDALRRETVDLGGRARPLAASAGIAMFEDERAQTGEDVLVNADLAMYDAKNAGRDRFATYAGGQLERSPMKGRVTWAQRIGTALENGGFSLVAQPIVDLATGAASQHELLLRLRDEQEDLVPPAAFLFIAERLGMVQEIDRWVTEQAIGLIADAHAAGQDLALEVNLSGLSISDPRLLTFVKNELERTGVAPGSVIFEITETAAVTNMTHATRFARALTELGCRFALDDFGAGYGSFYYLKQIPFDFLKIDGQFVKGCRVNATDRILIKAVVDIASGMGKRTIAEFVGDEETVQLLAQLGVDYGQGYYLGEPAALERHVPLVAHDQGPPGD